MKYINTFLDRSNYILNQGLRKDADFDGLDAKGNRVIRRQKHDNVMPFPKQDALHIACRDPSGEDSIRDAHIKYGQRLSRQERWDLLSAEIARADERRTMTSGMMPVAELVAFGARADVVNAVEHALFDGSPAEDAPLLEGIEALEHVLADHRGNFVVASIVAQAHIDLAWAWRGNAWDEELPEQNKEAFEAHFDRAADILSRYAHETIGSPLLLNTKCSLFGGSHRKSLNTANQYEALIDLNRANPRPMRAMGVHLLPRWHGTYEELELEARRTASRTIDTWGAGGYTWVQMDAIMCDDQACANLDLPFFIEGLEDILQRRPDPCTANVLAAYCANGVGKNYSGNAVADAVRSKIAECAHWIVREYLTELHPMIWAHAAGGFDNNLTVRSTSRFAAAGREDAIRIITSLFSNEIAAGKRIVFTDAGPVAQT